MVEEPCSGTVAGTLASDLTEPSLRTDAVLRSEVLLRSESCLMLADDLDRPRLARGSLLAAAPGTSDKAV